MRTIKNFSILALSAQRKDALEILERGYDAIKTKNVVHRLVRSHSPVEFDVAGHIIIKNPHSRIFVVAIGKCANEASYTLEEILGDMIDDGVSVDVEARFQLSRIRQFIGDHPFPSEKNIRSTQEIISLLRKTNENDIVIFIISGGGSTLLCQPENLACQNEEDIIRQLFRAGASIREVNTVRKHISRARGGYLAYYAYPARVVSLVFSDVPGDDLQFIASGPTVRDMTTIDDARAVLSRYCTEKTCLYAEPALLETPKDKKYFDKVSNILAVSNKTALEAMAERARALRYDVDICTTCLEGEARVVGRKIASEIAAVKRRAVSLYGGETTVTVRGQGKGGRNQEVALGAVYKGAGNAGKKVSGFFA